MSFQERNSAIKVSSGSKKLEERFLRRAILESKTQKTCYFCGGKHHVKHSQNLKVDVCGHCWHATTDPSILGYGYCSSCGNLRHITRHNPDLCLPCITGKKD